MFHRRTTSRLLLGLAVPVVLGLSLSACGSAADAAGEASQSALPSANSSLSGTVTLGAVLPLTGTNATIGMDQQRGIDLAVAKVNAADGVLGKQLVVQVEDSEGRADSAIQAARKLVSVDKVPAVIGEYSSGVGIPLQQFLQSQGVVGMNPGSSSVEVRKNGALQFSTIGLDDVAGSFTAKALWDDGYRSIAMLAPNNAYGSGMVASVTDSFGKLGGQVVTSSLYTEGQADYRAELSRLRDANPDAYVVTTYGKDGTTINKELYELGMTDKPVFDIYLSQDVPDADPQSVEGRTGMDVNASAPGSTYAADYQNAYGEPFISSFNGYTYDAVTMLADAINKAGSTDPQAIATALVEVSQTFEGVTGPIQFDADGQRITQPYIIADVKNGQIVPR